eukprot:TRINITY_DN1665_c0_g1_i1.p1 TRINITY_DN1665_c0_g1~~TRINITY_DN1665_c0_g1_i1.p1  ORF type:complete len:343 (+),score=56.50 TRINITY_DN1665_c0_g1_i1:111-1139(+)
MLGHSIVVLFLRNVAVVPKDNLDFLACILAINLLFLLVSYLQEKITFISYQGVHFRHSRFLSMINSLTSVFMGWFAYHAFPAGESPSTSTSASASTSGVGAAAALEDGYEALLQILLFSLAHSFAMELGYCSDRFLSYPAKILIKSCKMVPIMVMSFLVYGRHDGWKEYAFSIAIGGGASLFLAGKGSHNVNETENKWWLWGPLLVVVGIILDAYTNVAQDLFYMRFDVSPFLVLMWMNGFSAVFFAIWMTISGEFRKAWSTVFRNKTLARDIVGFALAGAFGHLVIFHFVREFGSLTNAYVCTLRKFNSILLSVIMYRHPVSFSQWVGVAIVFVSLFAKLM